MEKSVTMLHSINTSQSFQIDRGFDEMLVLDDFRLPLSLQSYAAFYFLIQLNFVFFMKWNYFISPINGMLQRRFEIAEC